LSREIIYEGKIINVYKDKVLLSNGNDTYREVVEHRDGAAVVAVDNEMNLLLVFQHRYPIAQDIEEIPAGLVDPGEQPLECAMRELLEETGYASNHWSLLTTYYPSPGSHDEKLHIFLAEQVFRKSGQNLDKDEILSFKQKNFDLVVSDIFKGNIKDGKTIIGVLMANQILRK